MAKKKNNVVRSSWGELNNEVNKQNRDRNNSARGKSPSATTKPASGSSSRTTPSGYRAGGRTANGGAQNHRDVQNNVQVGQQTHHGNEITESFNKGLSKNSNKNIARQNFASTRAGAIPRLSRDTQAKANDNLKDLGKRHLENIKASAKEYGANKDKFYQKHSQNYLESTGKDKTYQNVDRDKLEQYGGSFDKLRVNSTDTNKMQKQYEKDVRTAKAQEETKEKIKNQSNSAVGRFLWDAEGVGTEMLIDQLSNPIPGAAEVKGIKGAAKMLKSPVRSLLEDPRQAATLGTMGERVWGQNYTSAKEEGASNPRAELYGIGGAALEGASELMFGMGGKLMAGYGGGLGDDVVERALNVLANKLTNKVGPEGLKNLTYGALNHLAPMITEGLEEGVADIIDPRLANLIYANSVAEQTGDDSVRHQFSLSDMAYDMALGGFLGGMSGTSVALQNNSRGQQIKDIYGPDGMLTLANKVSEADEDIDVNKNAQVIIEQIKNGMPIANGQAVELMNMAQEQSDVNMQNYRNSMIAAEDEMKSQGLSNPYVVMGQDENGNTVLDMSEHVAEEQKNNQRIASEALTQVLSDNKGKGDTSYQIDADGITNAISDLLSGSVRQEDTINLFNINNTEARTALEHAVTELTGEDYSLPKSNKATREELFKLNAQMLTRMAATDKAKTVDQLKGLAIDEGQYGAETTRAYHEILDNIDDFDTDTARMIMKTFRDYARAGALGLEKSDVDSINHPVHQALSDEDKEMIYNASVRDNGSENLLEGVVTDSSKTIEETAKEMQKQGKTVTGGVIVDPSVGTLPQSKRRMLDEVGRTLNVKIHVVTKAWMLENGDTTEEQRQSGKAPNGYYSESTGEIFYAIDSTKPLEFVIGHETLHHLKAYAPSEYKKMKRLFVQQMGESDPNRLDNMIKSRQALYKANGQTLSKEGALEEIMADQMYEILQSPSFWEKVEKESPSLAKACIDAIRDMLDRIRRILTNENKFQPEDVQALYDNLGILDSMEDLALAAYKKASENALAVGEVKGSGTKFMADDPRMLTESRAAELIKSANEGKLEGRRYVPLRIGTPQIVIDSASDAGIEIENKPLIMQVGKLRQAMAEDNNEIYGRGHNLSEQDVLDVIKQLGDPLKVVYQKENGRVSEIVRVGGKGNPKRYVVIDFDDNNIPETDMTGFDAGNYNVIVTIFSPDDESYFNKKDFVTLYEKGTSRSVSGRIIPLNSNDVPFNVSVSSSNDNVKNSIDSDGNEPSDGPDIRFSVDQPDLMGVDAEDGVREINGVADRVRFNLASADTVRDQLEKSWNDQIAKATGDDRDKLVEDKESALTMYDSMRSLAESLDQDEAEYPNFKGWNMVVPKTNREGKAVGSVIVTNGEYSMNIDFSTICKKRRALDRLLFQLSKEGMFDTDVLEGVTIVELNEVLAEHGYEVSCPLCFVDTKRYAIYNWADSFTTYWNGVVNLLTKDTGVNASDFNFLNRNDVYNEENPADQADDSKLNMDVLDTIINYEGKITEPEFDVFKDDKGNMKGIVKAMAKAIKGKPDLRKKMTAADILASPGQEAVRSYDPELFTILNGHMGSAKPKNSYTDTPSTGEILASSWTPEKAFEVGGVRIQSFSDYIGYMFFDYVQTVAELEAKGLPVHGYTKEADFVRIFGKTGIKINMSLVPKVDITDEERERYDSYLKSDGDVKKTVLNNPKKKADYEYLKAKFERAGLDENGNYLWADESFGENGGQEGFELAVELLHHDDYHKNVGTIAVGVSDAHIRKLLNDPDISQVIPYHASGINKKVAIKNNIDKFRDYTKSQNDTVGSEKHAAKLKTRAEKMVKDGSLSKSNFEKLSFKPGVSMSKFYNFGVEEHFDFYDSMQKNNYDAKKVAKEYLADCDNKGIAPVFSQFRDEEGYYKMIIDFNSYDRDGNVSPQTAVKSEYPDNVSEYVKASVKLSENDAARLNADNEDFKAMLEEARAVVDTKYSIVDDEDVLAKLEEDERAGIVEPTYDSKGVAHFEGDKGLVKVYRAMAITGYNEDGTPKLSPPMAMQLDNKPVASDTLDTWIQSDEMPERIKKGNKFDLIKYQYQWKQKKWTKSTTPAAYNPWIHTSLSPLNDQFTSAYARVNLITVEGYVPVSEVTSPHMDDAGLAKDMTGVTSWHSGAVATALGKLDKPRNVILSKYFKANRVVPNSEVAQIIKENLDGTNIEIPYNVVAPQLREELEKIGVPVGEKAWGLKKDQPTKSEWDAMYDEHRDIIENIPGVEKREDKPKYSIDEDDIAEYIENHSDEFPESVPIGDEQALEGQERKRDTIAELENRCAELKEEMKLSHGKVLNKKSVKGDFNELVRTLISGGYKSGRTNNDMVNGLVANAATVYRNIKEDNWDDAAEVAYYTARELVDELVIVQDEMFRQYRDLAEEMKSTRLVVPQEVKDGIEEWNEFRKSQMGKLRLVNNGGVDIDVYYEELADRYPELFDKNITHPVDQLQLMAEVRESMRPYDIMLSSEDAESLAKQIAIDVLEITSENGESKITWADKKKQQYDDRLKAVKVRHQEALNQLREKERERTDKAKAETQKQKDKAKEKVSNSKRKAWRDKIEKDWEWLANRCLHPTESKPMPERLRKPIAELLITIDAQSLKSKKAENKAKIPIAEISGRSIELEEMYNVRSQKYLRLDALKLALKELADTDESFASIHDEGIEQLIDNFEDFSMGRPIDELDDETMDILAWTLKQLRSEVGRINKAFMEERSISELGEQVIAESKEHMAKHPKKWDGGHIYNLFNSSMVTPVDFFERLGDGMHKAFMNLRNGDNRHMDNMADAKEFFTELFKKYNNKKRPGSKIKRWRDPKKKQTFKVAGGEVSLTVAQMMALYCTQKRAAAMGHLLGSGIVPSDVSLKNNATALLGQKNSERKITKAIRINEADIQKICNKLTDEQKAIADELQNYINTKCTAWGNETSMLMYGYNKFGEPNYFPMKSERAFLDSHFDKEAKGIMESIKNMGFTKELTKDANNGIVIDDIFAVVTRHISEMSLYNSFAAPISDFTRLYNYRNKTDEGLNNDSVKSALDEAFGSGIDNYITHFMSDVQGQNRTRKNGLEKIIDTLLANSKKASIGANIRVALQQPTAIVRALALIDPKYFVKMDHTPNLMKKMSKEDLTDFEEMVKYCPVARRKSWGFSQTDLAMPLEDIIMNEWSMVDALTMEVYGALDNYTWSKIWKAVKAETKDKHPEVEYESEEFFKLCSVRATEVFDKTQVVDSVFHRSDAMRSDNMAVKMATAFMAEPTRTYNMLRTDIINAWESIQEGDKQKGFITFNRCMVVFVANAAACAVAQSLGDALRNQSGDGDDKDNEFWLLWYANFRGNVLVTNLVPILKEFGSWKEGWGASDMTFKGLADTVRCAQKIIDNLMGKNDDSLPSLILDLAKAQSSVTGIPVKNFLRDAKAMVDLMGLDAFAAEKGGEDGEESQNFIQQTLGSVLGKGKTTEKKDGSDQGDGRDEEIKREYIDYGIYAEDTKHGLNEKANHFIHWASQGKWGLSDESYAKEQERKEKYNRVQELKAIDDPDDMYKKATENYTKIIRAGDVNTILEMRNTLKLAGGDVAKFDKGIEKWAKVGIKKSLGTNNTKATGLKDFLKTYYGYTDESISRQIIEKSDLAVEFQKAAAMEDHEKAQELAYKLADAGITQEDFDWIYNHRWNAIEAEATGTYKWPVEGGRISSNFGARWGKLHGGMDIAVPTGTPVTASDGGVVTRVASDGSRGLYVDIKHPDGTYTRYQHLSSFQCEKGQKVSQGQPIALSGNTGNSTGPHLHFAVYQGAPQNGNANAIDPRKYLAM